MSCRGEDSSSLVVSCREEASTSLVVSCRGVREDDIRED
jgi:hypothetical protein